MGNLTVALLTGAAVYSVSMLYRSDNALITVFAVFAMFMTLVREIIKDIEDLKGDNTVRVQDASYRLGYPPQGGALCDRRVVCYYSRRAELSISRASISISADSCSCHCWCSFGNSFAPTQSSTMNLSTLCKVIMLMGIASMAFIFNPSFLCFLCPFVSMSQVRIAIFASGNGNNAEAIIKYFFKNSDRV